MARPFLPKFRLPSPTRKTVELWVEEATKNQSPAPFQHSPTWRDPHPAGLLGRQNGQHAPVSLGRVSVVASLRRSLRYLSTTSWANILGQRTKLALASDCVAFTKLQHLSSFDRTPARQSPEPTVIQIPIDRFH